MLDDLFHLCGDLFHIVIVRVQKDEYAVSRWIERRCEPTKLGWELIEQSTFPWVGSPVYRSWQRSFALVRMHANALARQKTRRPTIKEGAFGRAFDKYVDGHSGAPSSK